MTMTRTLQKALPLDDAEDDARWAAVLARDAASDGRFYTAVLTTGIYCRPSCPARHPARRNVRFFASCADAEAAGFRPCKRCKPNEAAPAEQLASKMADACRLIEDAEEEPRLDDLAAAAGLSPSHFHRSFKAIIGVTPRAYWSAERGKRVRANLGTSASVTEAIHEAGFNSSGRFYATSDAVLGMTPSAFRAGGSNADITFAVAPCALGLVLVAASAKGVCAIYLGDDAEVLERELRKSFPSARVIGGNPEFEAIVAKVVSLVDAPAAPFDVPLDIRGTAFQHRVWQAMRAIPPGETISYTELAHRIGAPSAVRAVAAACAANRIAVAIPCHRIVRSDGALSGYRWGVDRKRKLIRRESGS